MEKHSMKKYYFFVHMARETRLYTQSMIPMTHDLYRQAYISVV